jgi:hypothetical protein
MINVRSIVPIGVIGIGVLTAGVRCATAQEIAFGEEKSFTAVRTDTPPTIDGRLDEGEWANAAVIEDFYQILPSEYSEPSEKMRVHVLYDDDALYVAAEMWSEVPESLVANVLRQGEVVWSDDFFSVIIDPFNDRRSGYRFITNPNGVRMEALYMDTSRQQWNWQGIWRTAATDDGAGWVTEIAIPFKSLSFDPNNTEWGINFRRTVGRNNEDIGWVSRNATQNPSVVGSMKGLTGMNQGIGLDAVPSISLTRLHSFDPAGHDSDAEPSLDLFYKITSALNASLTINTDFSATEVDDRQVDLSRFSLFFPEKRAFFLKDSDIFEFGRLGAGDFRASNISRPTLENGRPFFSRRLGLSVDGNPVGIDYGGKLSGRIGRWNVGALALRQDAAGDVDATDLFVGRAVLNVLDESALGLIVTDGDPRSNLDNSVVGVDFRYLNSRMPGGGTIEAESWYQQSQTEGVDGDDAAYGARIRIPNNAGWRGGIGVKEIQQNFRPAMGFVNRSGIRDSTAELGYTFRMRRPFLRSVFFGTDAQRIDRIDGGLQSQSISLRLLDAESNQRDRLRVEQIASKEVLDQPFEISDGVVIPVGEYTFDDFGFTLTTGSQRLFSGELTYRQGDFYSGDREQIAGSLAWLPSQHFRLTVGYDLNDVSLPEGNFQVRLATLKADVIFSSRLSWVNLVQYDNVSETAGINSRLHWIPEAGREMFLVLNHTLQDFDRDNSFQSLSGDLTAKFNYTIRF